MGCISQKANKSYDPPKQYSASKTANKKIEVEQKPTKKIELKPQTRENDVQSIHIQAKEEKISNQTQQQQIAKGIHQIGGKEQLKSQYEEEQSLRSLQDFFSGLDAKGFANNELVDKLGKKRIQIPIS